MFAFAGSNVTDVVGPSNSGISDPMDAWTGPGDTGEYVIELRAVAPLPTGCGAEFTGPCGQVHPRPFCGNTACCEAVCTVDPFCCEVTWDSLCVSRAQFLCNNGEGGCGEATSGSCYAQHQNPYCDDPVCCALVCMTNPDCCDISWDASCVLAALKTCVDPCNEKCAGDLNNDFVVDGMDLAILLGAWSKKGCADIDGSGTVDGADLTLLLGGWGECDG